MDSCPSCHRLAEELAAFRLSIPVAGEGWPRMNEVKIEA